MKWNDIINGVFELVGAYFTWRNYFQLRKDRDLKGIWWPLIAFMTAWGFWNIIYYPSLGQWFSFAGGLVLVLGNAFWVNLALKLKYAPKNGQWEVRAGSWERYKNFDGDP